MDWQKEADTPEGDEWVKETWLGRSDQRHGSRVLVAAWLVFFPMLTDLLKLVVSPIVRNETAWPTWPRGFVLYAVLQMAEH